MDLKPIYSEEAERAVLGSILIDPKTFASVHSIIKSTDFYLIANAAIYAVMEQSFEEDIPIDTIILCEKLKATGKLSYIGGPAYLTTLAAETPTSRHVEIYAQMIRACRIRRQIIVVSDEIKTLAYDESQDVGSICADVERRLLTVTGDGRPQFDEPFPASVKQYLDGLEIRMGLHQQGKSIFIPTGIPDFDTQFGGSYPGELLVFGGPAKLGKTTFTLSIARNRARMGLCQAIFSTEMSRHEIIQKWVAMETGINVMKLKAGNLTAQQYGQVLDAMAVISSWKVHIFDDIFPLTPLDVRRELFRLKHKIRVDCILIDGLWQMKHFTKIDNRASEVNTIMIYLARLAQRENVPVDIVHQLKRAAENRQDKRPVLSDMAESVGVERNADMVIGLYREDYYTHDDYSSGGTEAFVLANRTGQTRGRVKLGFDKDRELYTSYSYTTPDRPAMTSQIQH